jgi:hypothetical protein
MKVLASRSDRDHNCATGVSGTDVADCAGCVRQRIGGVQYRHDPSGFDEGLQGDQVRRVLKLDRRAGLLAQEECRQVRLDQVGYCAAGMPSPLGSNLPLGVRARRVRDSEWLPTLSRMKSWRGPPSVKSSLV